MIKFDDRYQTNDNQYKLRLQFLKRHGVDATCTCYPFPTQFEGTLDGKMFYYRARGGEWQMCIADTLDDAIDGKGFQIEGDDDYDGMVPLHLALLTIWNVAKQYRAQS